MKVDLIPFSVRALEIHGMSMWLPEKIFKALDFIENTHLNTLVLHENELIDKLLFLEKYYGDPSMFNHLKRVGHPINVIYHTRAHIRKVIQLAHARNIAVILEVKELTFPEQLTEKYPELINNGIVCPTHPLWYDFLHDKYTELSQEFSEIDGIIVSHGSAEGRASLVSGHCQCNRCQTISLYEWYKRSISAMHEPWRAKHIKFAVREFAYKPEHHEPLIKAIEDSAPAIVFCIKNTVRDFYPTFPHNRAIGQLDREQWLEYDVMGQYYGWGIFPCMLLDDLKKRIHYAIKNNVEGIIYRTDWERLKTWNCLDSLNTMNLFGGAILAQNPNEDVQKIMKSWVSAQFTLSSPGTCENIVHLLSQTWGIVSKALYINGHVFNDSSMYPWSIDQGWWIMTDKHALSKWRPERQADLALNPENLEKLIADKEEAEKGIKELIVQANLAFIGPDQEMNKMFNFYATYIRTFSLLAKITLLYQFLKQHPGKDHLRRLKLFVEELSKIREENKIYSKNSHPFHLPLLLDAEKLSYFIEDTQNKIKDFLPSE